MRRRFMQNGIFLPKREKYLTILALEDGLTVSFNSVSGSNIEYCIDDSFDWIILEDSDTTPEINNGHNIKFRGNLLPQTGLGIGTFYVSKKCELMGNCYSLVYGDKAYILDYKLPKYVFTNLFFYYDGLNYNSPLIKVSSDFLYSKKLNEFCYDAMFRDTDIIIAPELPAEILTKYCYSYMFFGCNNLRYIKMLATDISADGCLDAWTVGVPSEGIFIKHPEMNSLPSGDSGIPNGWTVYDAYLGQGLEFPLRLNFDGYDVGASEAYRHADSTSKMLVGYLAEILGTHGEYDSGGFEVNSETLNKLGVEIYIEDVKVIGLNAGANDGFSLLYLFLESDIPMGNSGYKCTLVRIDNTGYITGDLEW